MRLTQRVAFLAAQCLIAMLFASCASVGVTPVKVAAEKQRNCPLEVFTSEAEIKRPYEVVCLIDTQKKAALGESSVADAIAASKPAACKCGADGIWIVTGSVQSANMFNYGSAHTILKAIRFTDK